MITIVAIFLAEYVFLLPILVGAVYFLFQPYSIKKQMIVLSVVSLLLTILSMFVLNNFYDNPRPEVVADFQPLFQHFFPNNGFPSTHATLTALIASVLYIFNRKIGLFLFIISILVSFSRVFLGQHHFVDIVAGILLAIVTVTIVQGILNRFIFKYTEKSPYL